MRENRRKTSRMIYRRSKENYPFQINIASYESLNRIKALLLLLLPANDVRRPFLHDKKEKEKKDRHNCTRKDVKKGHHHSLSDEI